MFHKSFVQIRNLESSSEVVRSITFHCIAHITYLSITRFLRFFIMYFRNIEQWLTEVIEERNSKNCHPYSPDLSYLILVQVSCSKCFFPNTVTAMTFVVVNGFLFAGFVMVSFSFCLSSRR